MSIWGNPIQLGGGGGGVPLLTRAEWNALTTAQKQSFGLVSIQDSSTGFKRGELVCGAAYLPAGVYIPYSDVSSVLCEAYVDNFEASSQEWGVGNAPLRLQDGLNPQFSDEENAVYLGISATERFAYTDLGAEKAPYTAYIVARLVSPGTYTRVLSSMASRSSGNGMMIFGNTLNVTSWASDTSTGVSSSAAFFAAALQFGGTGSGAGVVGSGGTLIAKSPSNSSRYLTI